MKRIRNRFDAENIRISNAYKRKRREEAIKRAAKAKRARKK